LASLSKKLTIKFQFNNLKTIRRSSIRTTLAIDAINVLKAAIVESGEEAVLQKVKKNATGIKRVVENDLAEYTKRALKFFLNIESPNTLSGKRKDRAFAQKSITFNDPDGLASKLFSARNTQSSFGPSQRDDVTVVWQALAPATIANKKKRSTTPLKFYRDSGNLSRVLTQKLGPTFKKILDFKITVSKNEEVENQHIIRVQAVPSSRLTKSSLAALGGSDFALGSSGKNSTIVSFLQAGVGASGDRLLEKLSNGNRGGGTQTRVERPFLQPVLGFWLLRRFPKVFQKAVAEVI
jgi:hypothetical protein